MVNVLANVDGFFYFHILDEAFCQKIVDDGPVTILGVPMILQQWHSMSKLKEKPT